MQRSPIHTTIIALFSALTALPVLAAGRAELNQTVIEQAGGFPYTITSPGNYVLTGDLVVPASTDGIVVATTDVTLDLNGFSISSSFVCSQGACAAGNGSGVRPGPSVAFGHYSAVKNGAIRGFANDCISLGLDAEVNDMAVRNCGRYGILVNSGGVVRGNRARSTGSDGLYVLNATYSDNAVSNVGLSGGGGLAIVGGAAAGGNFCDDGSCSRNGRRLFLMTRTPSSTGATAAASCPLGFHMASLWEILDPSALQYDTSRGYLPEDGVEGAVPTSIAAWIRTGQASVGGSLPGLANCGDYTSTAGTGTAIYANHVWEWDPTASSEVLPLWWGNFTVGCNSLRQVWCVQD